MNSIKRIATTIFKASTHIFDDDFFLSIDDNISEEAYDSISNTLDMNESISILSHDIDYEMNHILDLNRPFCNRMIRGTSYRCQLNVGIDVASEHNRSRF